MALTVQHSPQIVLHQAGKLIWALYLSFAIYLSSWKTANVNTSCTVNRIVEVEDLFLFLYLTHNSPNFVEIVAFIVLKTLGMELRSEFNASYKWDLGKLWTVK